MILLDDRQGSAHLEAPLVKMGNEVRMTRLDCADVAFVGTDQRTQQVPVGIEIKSVQEVIDDLVVHRFGSSQLPKMLATYPYRWLFIEGPYRASPYSGKLEQPYSYRPGRRPGKKGWVVARLGKHPLAFTTFANYLFTIEIQGGFGIRHTKGRPETAAQVSSLHHWWTQGWLSHKSLSIIYEPPARTLTPLEDPGLVRRAACLLDGISWEKSKGVSKAFPTVQAMSQATQAEWCRIPGIGPKIARQSVMQLKGEIE